MGHDVRAPLKGTAVDGGGEGVVQNQGDAVAVGGSGKFFNVQHRQRRIGDGLAENGLRIGTEGCVQLLRCAVRLHKGEVHAHALHGHGKEIVAAAVNAGGGHHMIPAGGDVEHGIEIGRLTGGGEHGRRAALQRRDFGCHCVVGGILQPGVEIAAGLQIEELPHVAAGSVFEGGALNDRHLPGFAAAGSIACLYAFGSDA